MGLSALLLAFLSPSPSEMLLLVLVALLLYGGDLPKVARSWGKSLSELRKSLSGIQNEINDVIYDRPRRISYRDPRGDAGEYGGVAREDTEDILEAEATVTEDSGDGTPDAEETRDHETS